MTRCAACESSRSRPLYAVHGFNIVACADCGLARTELPPDFDPSSIYSASYFDGGQADGYADYLGSRGTLQAEFRRVLEALARHGVAGGSLIEIGCAYGFLLEEARARFSVCGVEVSDPAREDCRARGLVVAREASADFMAANGPFDAAVMLDVIEHLSDPGAVLAALRAAMRPGGRLVVTTGDFGALSAKLLGRRWRLMTPPQHLWFFSVPAISALLERTGFRVRDVKHPWKIVPLSLIGYQAFRFAKLEAPEWLRKVPGGIPINLYDAMRVVAEPI